MLRALLIDDEAPARNELAFMLQQTHNVEIVGEASNVPDAAALIKTVPCDVIFLDIHMPGYNGLQLAESLKTHPRPPAIIFVTAHSRHALDAFAANAVDYLVKPVQGERLETAIGKVLRMQGSDGEPAVSDSPDGPRVTVKRGNTQMFLPATSIQYAMAKDDYTYLHTKDGHHLTSVSLASLEETLEEAGFFRIHRRYLINLARVQSIAPGPNGTLELTLDDEEQTVLPVSRRRVAELRRRLK